MTADVIKIDANRRRGARADRIAILSRKASRIAEFGRISLAWPNHTRVLYRREIQTSLLLLRDADPASRPAIAGNVGKSYTLVRFAETSTRMYLAPARCDAHAKPENQFSGFWTSKLVMLPSRSSMAVVAAIVVAARAQLSRLDAQSVDRSALTGSSCTRPRARRVMGATGAASPSRFAASTSIRRISPTAA